MQILFQKRGGGLFGFLIRLWTNSEYCHCEIELRDGTRLTSSPMYGVVQHPPLSIASLDRWDELHLPDVTREDEDAIRKFFAEEMGAGYDWKGILLSHVIKAGVQSRSRWFCSEFCAAALTGVGHLVLKPGERPTSFSPEKLYRRLRSQLDAEK